MVEVLPEKQVKTNAKSDDTINFDIHCYAVKSISVNKLTKNGVNKLISGTPYINITCSRYFVASLESSSKNERSGASLFTVSPLSTHIFC